MPLPYHLRQLESESIYIMREVAAEFSKPVMLYSIGKDSSVMLHIEGLARGVGSIEVFDGFTNWTI